MKDSIKKIRPYFYYILLVIVFFLWTSESQPNMLLRIAYLAAYFFPAIFNRDWNEFTPAIFFVGLSLAFYNYNPAYFPTDLGVYLLFAILVSIISRKKVLKERLPLFVFFLYTIIVNLLTDGEIQDISISLLILVLIFTSLDYSVSSRKIRRLDS